MTRTYSELITLKTFEERYHYLRIAGQLGVKTFGFDRWINQGFYTSKEWKDIRRKIIIRDESCDLGMADRSIFANIRIHHMNPLAIDDIIDDWELALNPEHLICCSLSTHNAIHFGNEQNLIRLPKERQKGDTTLWKAY